MAQRAYAYVGPDHILEHVDGYPPGAAIRTASDVLEWLRSQGVGDGEEVVATYTIDTNGLWRLADRHSEHVACAGRVAVYAAGEITLLAEGGEVWVTHVTNQSTGYCPEASCWPVVDDVLSALGLDHPEAFSISFEFRRCEECGSINVVKDWYECGCGAQLPERYNF